MSVCARALLTAAAPGGRRGLSILFWHRVLAAPDPLLPELPDAAAFERQLQTIAAVCCVLPLDEAVARLRAGTLPPRAACLSFDDGYRDNADIALPLLLKYRLPAVFYIATGFLDGGIMWNDVVIEAVRQAPGPVLDGAAAGLGLLPLATPLQRRAAIGLLLAQLKYLPLAERAACAAGLAARAGARLPGHLMLDAAQVRALHAAGMTLGAHTVDHPILARLDAAAARHQIGRGRAALEALVGPVRHFAYPNGKPGRDYTRAHVALVRALGFESAVTTAAGAGADLLQLPRFTPWDRTPLRWALRLARNLRRPARLA